MTDATVFIVDDDPSVRDSLSLLLSLRDVRAQAFASAKDFLDYYLPDLPGCALIDLRMPAMDGLSLQRELRQRGWGLPCIVMSAYGDVATTRAALKEGAFDFLEKPLDDPEVLIDIIANAIHEDTRQREAGAHLHSVRTRVQRLTNREREVMTRIATGMSHREIGADLGISPRTVEVYKARLFEKLQIKTIADLVRIHDALETSSGN